VPSFTHPILAAASASPSIRSSLLLFLIYRGVLAIYLLGLVDWLHIISSYSGSHSPCNAPITLLLPCIVYPCC
jgi:hypothetical protein